MMTNPNNRDLRDRPIAANPNAVNRTPVSNQADLADGIVERPAARNQTAYQDGYWQGRYSERNNLAQRRADEEEGVASGVIFGILLASLFGLGLGTYFYLTGQNRTPEVAPNVVNPSPSPAQPPEVRERIIERDRVVPVPQQAPDTPDVNITLPNQPAPESRVTQPAPAPETNPDTTTQPAPAQSGQ